MSTSFDLTDIFDKEEVEFVYKRGLSDEEWEQICFNLRSRFWTPVRKDMMAALEDAPDFFLQKR